MKAKLKHENEKLNKKTKVDKFEKNMLVFD